MPTIPDPVRPGGTREAVAWRDAGHGAKRRVNSENLLSENWVDSGSRTERLADACTLGSVRLLPDIAYRGAHAADRTCGHSRSQWLVRSPHAGANGRP